MKDFFEPFLYPHNLTLLGLVAAYICYRKKGLLVLLLFYYLSGNNFIANQFRSLYVGQTVSHAIAPGSAVVLLGCGGTDDKLTACASARIQHLAELLPAEGASVLMTSKHCKPYLNKLKSLIEHKQVAVDCIDGGENTYQEFNSLAARTELKPDYIVTSDFHAWRVNQLVKQHNMHSKVLSTSSQTFRELNCNGNCMFTVNLSNFDFYSKLISEFSSFAVYSLTYSWTDWYIPDTE
ncbi:MULTISPECIES: hypothetical protein [Rheinheimera]|uniref:hypothetical protein n=1 Tax=Rheinheimera TaxID=67575 RepID=UPI0010445012|nr:hypothetical protein [Rheinheimera sp. D18]QBL09723.1 hypothetical protein E0Z06_09440 [Rheinheimera sp. D18]